MGSFLQRVSESLRRAWLSAKGRIETHVELMFAALVVSIVLALWIALDYWGGHSERIPMTIIYVGSWPLMLALPMVLVWAHRRRQQHVMTKVRSVYAIAEENLIRGRDQEVRRGLCSIRRWEQHWRIGNSALYRIAYATFVVGTTSLVAVVHFVAHANVYSQSGHGQVAHKSLDDTVRYLLEHPIQLWLVGIFSLLFGFKAVEHLKDLASAPWSKFYGDRLEAALKAGRTLSEAPWHDRPLPKAGVSARELLGLPQTFTSAQLRRAWLKLVRELHPDRWATAGEGVQKIKEAALKRVNAARDELASHVSD